MMADKPVGQEPAHDEYFHDEDEVIGSTPEPAWASYIPGGYARGRCLRLQGKPMLYAILSFAGCSILFFGYDASVMSQINTNEDYLRVMGAASGSNRAAAEVGGLVSVWFLGFSIGAILVGNYADSIGRLRAAELGCLWGILGAALQASAQNVNWMILARIIGGVGCGHLNTIVPVWTSELADPHLRGAFVAVEFTLALVGSTMVYWMEFGCVKTQSLAFAWRFPLAFQIVFLIFLLLAQPFFPESPRYLLRTGRGTEAREVLERCRVDPSPERIRQELAAIREAIRIESTVAQQSFLATIFKRDELHTRRRMLLGAGVQVMQKLTGIDFIAAYAPTMFSLSGFTGDVPALLAGGNFISYTFSLALAIYLADKVGRRRMMLTGCTIMGLVLIAGGALSREVGLTANTEPARAKRFGAGVAAVLYVYTFTYGCTWLTTCWVYPTEVFPLESRAKGAALATVAFAVAGGIINEIIPYLVAAVTFWIFFIFAILNLLMLAVIWPFYIETANRPLEDLDFLFSTESVFAWRAERDFAERKRVLAAAAGGPREKEPV